MTSQSDTSKSFNILEQLDGAAAGHDMTPSWDVCTAFQGSVQNVGINLRYWTRQMLGKKRVGRSRNIILVPEHLLDRDAEGGGIRRALRLAIVRMGKSETVHGWGKAVRVAAAEEVQLNLPIQRCV
nr:hypothetical protein B24P7.330 [imported] - Neurospora crassa [Neurospora crassa]